MNFTAEPLRRLPSYQGTNKRKNNIVTIPTVVFTPQERPDHNPNGWADFSDVCQGSQCFIIPKERLDPVAVRFAKAVIRRKTTKTDAGERAIPLNRDAVVALGELWNRCCKLGSSEPDHFVFPACPGASPALHRPCRVPRFHDLRHQAITELGESGQSDQTIMSIAGHVSRKMLDLYSHIRLAAKRRALEALETPLSEPVAQTPEQAEARSNYGAF